MKLKKLVGLGAAMLLASGVSVRLRASARVLIDNRFASDGLGAGMRQIPCGTPN